MAYGDTYDEATGVLIPGSGGEATTAAQGQASPQTPEQRRADVEAFVRSLYAQFGITPSASDLASDVENYIKYGGDQLRANLKTRAGSTGGGGFKWSDYGAPPAGFGEEYSAGTYQPREFQEKFNAPTVEDLLKDPGYLADEASMQRGLERSAAAKGSVLSGGFVGRALPRALGEFTSKAYDSRYGRAFGEYQSRYGQFSDSAAREADAFKTNEVGKLNQFQTRYKSYADVIANRRQSEEDRWQREMDLSRLGLGAAGGG